MFNFTTYATRAKRHLEQTRVQAGIALHALLDSYIQQTLDKSRVLERVVLSGATGTVQMYRKRKLGDSIIMDRFIAESQYNADMKRIRKAVEDYRKAVDQPHGNKTYWHGGNAYKAGK